jgi:hypothetical protein
MNQLRFGIQFFFAGLDPDEGRMELYVRFYQEIPFRASGKELFLGSITEKYGSTDSLFR